MEKLEVSGNIKHEGDPFTVEITRGQRGGYGWTVKARGDDQARVLEAIRDLDDQLRKAYLGAATDDQPF
jgi:hypothetical protein